MQRERSSLAEPRERQSPSRSGVEPLRSAAAAVSSFRELLDVLRSPAWSLLRAAWLRAAT